MGTTKLTKFQREAIASRATAFAFDGPAADLKKVEDALAREAYATLYSPAELKAVSKVPDNWIRRDACLRLNVGGQDITLCVEGDGLPVPYRPSGQDHGSYYCNRLGVIQHGELCDRIQTFAQQMETHKAARRAAYKATLAMLEAVSTTGKLAEVWPEGRQFFAHYEDRPVPNLPAVRVADVNAMLGLAA